MLLNTASRYDYLCIGDIKPAEPQVTGRGLIKELGYSQFGCVKLKWTASRDL